MNYLEDIRDRRDEAETGRHTFTAEEIKAFAVKFDPQPFHVDEAAAARSIYGGLIASGWHTAAVCMRFIVDYTRSRRRRAARAASRWRAPACRPVSAS